MIASLHRVVPAGVEQKSRGLQRQTAFWWRIDVERRELWCAAGVRPHCTIVWLLRTGTEHGAVDIRYKSLQTQRDYMSPRRRLFNFAIDDDLATGLKAIKARTGVSESEQVRRAIQMWLEAQGEMKKAERKRAATRKRS
jgi:hypothetical protein